MHLGCSVLRVLWFWILCGQAATTPPPPRGRHLNEVQLLQKGEIHISEVVDYRPDGWYCIPCRSDRSGPE